MPSAMIVTAQPEASEAGALPLAKEMHWLAIDEDPGDAASSWRQPLLGADDIAFLQYT